MDGNELRNCLGYDGMIRSARRFAVEKKLTTIEEIAEMTENDICNLILKDYDVISVENECVSIINKEFAKEYNKNVTHFER